ncbi:MAG: hypothetical protein INR71_06055 [Terriglobus roseus]|nr:hypothetical protein [Terriglobus roseus]
MMGDAVVREWLERVLGPVGHSVSEPDPRAAYFLIRRNFQYPNYSQTLSQALDVLHAYPSLSPKTETFSERFLSLSA